MLCLYARGCYLHKYCCHVCIHTRAPSSPSSCFSSPPSQVGVSPTSSSSSIFVFMCVYRSDWDNPSFLFWFCKCAAMGNKTGSSIPLVLQPSAVQFADGKTQAIYNDFILYVVLQQWSEWGMWVFFLNGNLTSPKHFFVEYLDHKVYFEGIVDMRV